MEARRDRGGKKRVSVRKKEEERDKEDFPDPLPLLIGEDVSHLASRTRASPRCFCTVRAAYSVAPTPRAFGQRRKQTTEISEGTREREKDDGNRVSERSIADSSKARAGSLETLQKRSTIRGGLRERKWRRLLPSPSPRVP